MKTLTAIVIAALTLTTACAEESEPVETEHIFEVLDGPSDQLSAPPIDLSDVDDEEVDDFELELGAPFVRECNVCVLTIKGAYCTQKVCDEIDERDAPACGEFGLDQVWADDCNLCTCTDAGTVCTASACEI